MKRNSSNIEDKIRDFEARRGKTLSADISKYKQPAEVSKSPRTSFGRPIKFSFKSSYSSELDGKIDDRTLPIGTKYSSKDECYIAIVPEDDICVNDGRKSQSVSLERKSRTNKKDNENVARETAVCIIDSVLDSAKNIVETRLVDKPYKENITNNKKNSEHRKSLEKKKNNSDKKLNETSKEISAENNKDVVENGSNKNEQPVVNGEQATTNGNSKNDEIKSVSKRNSKNEEENRPIIENSSTIITNGDH